MNVKRISIEYKEIIWDLITRLIENTDLSEEKEIENIQRKWLPREMHLNSIHGVAMQAIFSYISWIIESEPEKYENETNKVSKINTAILDLFENLLNDKLYTTKYIFGFNLTYLIHLEEDWVRDHIDTLMSTENLDYFEAIWAGFIDNNSIYSQIFRMLRPYYLHALELINKNEKLIPYSKDQFINQIAMLYLQGIEPLEVEESLISIFLNTASDSHRKIFVRNIGVNLDKYQNKGNIEEIKNRLRSLLEIRLEKIESNQVKEYIQELDGFTHWFRNSIFNKSWMINKFLEILNLLGDSLKTLWPFLDSLIGYADDHSEQVIDILEIITKREIEDGYLLFEDKYKKILKILLNSENEEVKQRTVDLINYLLKMNLHSFKDLLSESS